MSNLAFLYQFACKRPYLNTQKLIMVIPKLRMGRTLQIALKLLVKNGDKRMGGG